MLLLPQRTAILGTLANIYFANSKLLPLSQVLHLFAELYHIHSEQVNDLLTTGLRNLANSSIVLFQNLISFFFFIIFRFKLRKPAAVMPNATDRHQ